MIIGNRDRQFRFRYIPQIRATYIGNAMKVELTLVRFPTDIIYRESFKLSLTQIDKLVKDYALAVLNGDLLELQDALDSLDNKYTKKV
jgi:hypothetical protein